LRHSPPGVTPLAGTGLPRRRTTDGSGILPRLRARGVVVFDTSGRADT